MSSLEVPNIYWQKDKEELLEQDAEDDHAQVKRPVKCQCNGHFVRLVSVKSKKTSPVPMIMGIK